MPDNAKPNKVILVTGGSRGLGRRLVERLSSSGGNKVYFTYAHSEENARQLEAEYVNSVALRCEQTDEVQIKNCISRIQSEEGRLDVLINNACSPFKPCDFSAAGWDAFQELLDTNVKGTYHFMKEASEIMRTQGHGRIINILSSYVLGVPPEKLSFYITAKYALLGLSRSAAAELSKYGITVNMVSPGLMATDLSGYLPRKYLEVYASKHPMKRMATVDDAADAVEHLISEGAKFLNGVNIPVNGGEVF